MYVRSRSCQPNLLRALRHDLSLHSVSVQIQLRLLELEDVVLVHLVNRLGQMKESHFDGMMNAVVTILSGISPCLALLATLSSIVLLNSL